MIAVWVDALLEPLRLRFFVLALAASVLVLLAGAAVGFQVLVRHQAYLGQGIGQAMLAGVAFGAWWDLAPTLAAFAGALVASVVITALTKVRTTTPDAAIAVVATSAMAAGVAAMSVNRDRSVNVTNVLFGNVLGVTGAEVCVLAVVTGLAWAVAYMTGRLAALDALAPEVAVAHGVPVRRLELVRMVTLAATIAASVQVVGVTLVVAAIVFPAAVGVRCARMLAAIHAVAAAVAAVTAVAGLYLSYWTDVASGPAIVLTGTVGYMLAVAATTRSR